jgi:monoamine oxidase
VSRLLNLAHYANKHGLSDAHLYELAEAQRSSSLSRRDVMRCAAAAGLVLNAACKARGGSGARVREDDGEPQTSVPAEGEGDNNEQTEGGRGEPVVILGAGVAGLTAAYKLSKAGIPSVIYEGRPDRVGGRILTKDNFNGEGMFCELGAELVDSGHTNLLDLCRELNVEIQEFVEPEGIAGEMFFFGGKLLQEKDLLDKMRVFAKIIDQDRKAFVTADGIQTPTAKQTFGAEKLDNMSLRQYLDSKTGKVDKFALDMVAAAYTGEYGLLPEKQSALNFLVLIGTDVSNFKMFGPSDESKRIKGGNSRIIDALKKATDAAGVKVNLGHKLKAVSDNGSRMTLTFTGPGNKTVTVTSAQVICTIPYTMLREVDGIYDLPMSDVKKASIRELGFGTLSKFMIGFTEKMWRKQNGKTPPSNGSLYTDTRSRQFWESSRMQPGKSGIITNFLSAEEGLNVSPNQLALSLQDLEKVFKGISNFKDGKTALQAWPKDPFTKMSYTCPAPGQYTKFFGLGTDPELNGRLIFAGEHTSVNWQGFMEGGIETGAMAVQSILAKLGRTGTTRRALLLGRRTA